MNRILFITTRNVLNTSGEFRLIKNRTKTLYEKWNVQTEFIVVCSNKKIESQNEELGSNSLVTSIGFENNPISVYSAFVKGKRNMLDQLRNEEYKCIILSGIGMLEYIPSIRKVSNDIPIIVDIHGVKEELLEYNTGSTFKKMLKTALYYYTKYSENKHLIKADGTLVVSKALANNLREEYGLDNLNQYVVPCAIDNNNIDDKEKKLLKSYYREKYNIAMDETVFIYSGGVSPWQCIDKSIEIFKRINEKKDLRARMMIFSHQADIIRAKVADDKNIIVDSLSSDEVNKALCMGDFALLIRENYITNNVAYPNKFLEYVQSGMKVISTPYIFDVAEEIVNYDVGVIIDLNNYCSELAEYFGRNETLIEDSAKRKELLYSSSFEYTLKSFVDNLSLSD
ncbi:MAG: glycosyltransferase [Bacillota bacterium]